MQDLPSELYPGQSEGTVSNEKEAQEQKQCKPRSHPRRQKMGRNRPGLSRQAGPDDEFREKMLMNFFMRQSRRENPEQQSTWILCIAPHA